MIASLTDVPLREQMFPLLSVQQLQKQYKTRQGTLTAFEGIDLAVQLGEVVCLLGASGCGKSSLLATIAGLQTADRGDIYLNGNPVRRSYPHVGSFRMTDNR
ncbi:ATP-binding cassette domain-containing protein [Stenomitos frigidus]|nr:ATP-binding cassette domain-containing protein [Stenomitos frigidus]